MCDRMFRTGVRGTGVAVLLACIAGTSPARLEAQDAAPYRARVDSIARLWEAARESAARADSARRAAITVDTIMRGALVVMTTPQFTDVVEPATQLAWEQLGATLREDTALMRGRAFYVVSTKTEDPVPERIQQEAEVIAYADGSTFEDVATKIGQRIEIAAIADLDEPTSLFFGNHVPLRPYADRGWTKVYVELATAPWSLVRACYLGDLGRCAEASDVPAADDPVTEWYDAADRRRYVAADPRWYHERDPRRTQCIDAGSDRACLDLLRSLEPGELRPPLSERARHSLAVAALELGGDGAYGRLLSEASHGPEQRLMSAAGISRDSLFTAWHARVLAAGPEPTTITRVAGWTAFFWVIAFATLAARSSRWRRA